MIFVTVGTQLPFDRLIAMVDDLAPSLNTPVFAQTGSSRYHPKNIDWSSKLSPTDFDERFELATKIVSHAGIGTILTAQRLAKPIILVPRELRFGEHRNDHQLATCNQLAGRTGIYVARTASELSELLARPELPPVDMAESLASRKTLIDNLASLLQRAPAQ